VCNRADKAADIGGRSVFLGGENNIAVYEVDGRTGEPTLIQSADTHGIYPRTFAIDPNASILVVANQKSLLVKEGETMRTVSPNLAVFRIKRDGKLDYVRQYDLEAGEEMMFWMGMVNCL
jgi:6-phosphogluconolactonase